jgi:hypothetical protein
MKKTWDFGSASGLCVGCMLLFLSGYTLARDDIVFAIFDGGVGVVNIALVYLRFR